MGEKKTPKKGAKEEAVTVQEKFSRKTIHQRKKIRGSTGREHDDPYRDVRGQRGKH